MQNGGGAPPAIVCAIPPGVRGGESFNVVVENVTYRVTAPPNAPPGQLIMAPLVPNPMVVQLPQAQPSHVPVGVPVRDAGEAAPTAPGRSESGTHTLRRRAQSPAAASRRQERAAPPPRTTNARSGATEDLLGAVDFIGDISVRQGNELLVKNRMHRITLCFDDPAMEAKYRHAEFSKHFWNYVTAIVTMAVTLVLFTAQTLPQMAMLTTFVFGLAIAIRSHFHYMEHVPWRLTGWNWALLFLASAMVIILTLGGARASGTMVEEKSPNPDYIGMMCVTHLLFYFVASMAVFGDAALYFPQKIALFVVVIFSTVPNGVPSPSINLKTSAATSILGGLIGLITSRSFDYHSRESFLQETILRDAMLVWRAAAVMAGQ